MAKNTVEIDVKVDDKGSTKKVGLEAKKTAEGMDKASKSAGTLDRNMKGAGQASSGAAKNFSKMSQGMGGLVGTYATLAATVFAVSAAFQFLKNAADYKNLIEGQKALGAVTGVAYKTISNSLVEATNGQLKYAEAAKAAAIGTAAGINPDQLSRLGKAATNASIALGRDLGDSFDRLIRGVTKAEPELLDELGIILRLEAATAKYGAKIGKAAGDLNEFERSQAVANEVLEQAERKFGAMEKLMDPNAAALNRFSVAFDNIVNTIKEGISGPIAGIATFLSKNIIALIGTLSLFAGGVLKQILPSMSDWKKSSIEAGEVAKASQVAVQAEIEKTRAAYIALQKAQSTGISETTRTSLAGVTGAKKGGGAIDFLRGDTDTKKSMQAADKALTNAENQLRDSATKRTGILKTMNAAQVADLRASYIARAAIIKKGEADFKLSMTGMKLSWSSFVLSVKAGTTALKISFATLAAGVASVGVAIGAIFFWVSTITLVGGLLYELYLKFKTTSKAEEEAAEKTESLKEKYKTLGDEIKRSLDYLKQYDSVSPQERLLATGNITTSLNIEKFIDEINALDKNKEGYDDLVESMKPVALGAKNLNSGFSDLYKALSSGEKITKDAGAAMITLSNDIQAGKQALDKFPAATRLVEAELTKLLGTLKRPFGSEYVSSLTNMTKESNTIALAFQAEAANIIRNKDALEAELLKTTEKYKHRSKKVLTKEQKADSKRSIEAAKLLTDQAAKYAKLSEDSAAAVKQVTAVIEARRDIEKTIIDNQVKASEMQTIGITYEQKKANLAAAELTANANLLRLESDRTLVLLQKGLLEQKLIDLRKKSSSAILSPEEQLQLDLLIAQYDMQGKLISIEEARKKLAEQSRINESERLTLANTANKEESNRLGLMRAQIDMQEQLNFAKAGGTGKFGVARAREVGSLTQESFASRRALAAQELTDAKRAQADTLGLTNSTLAEKNAAQASVNASIQKQTALENEIALYNKRGELVLLDAKAETEAAQAKLTGLSLNPAVTAFNEKMQENKLNDIVLSQEQQKMLYAEIEAQTLLNQALEVKSGIFSSLTDNISSAFGSIVDGTKSAKQAFGDMAIAILKDISQMIIRMMVMRALMSLVGGFGGGTPATGAGVGALKTGIPAAGGFLGGGGTVSLAPSGGFNLIPGGRYGGMFSAGDKLPGYATGGIAMGSQGGYPVTLHGTEAVVPLPNGKSIPVEMKNGSAQNNSVVVNVSMDGSGTSSQTEQQKGEGMGNLGNAIAQAVQQELQNQKRSGGILNPYGVA